jgi:uncharacterized protein DUF4232
MESKRLHTIAVLTCGGGMAALALTGCKADGGLSSSSSPPSPPSISTPSPSTTSTAKSAGDTGRKPTAGGQGDTPSCMAGQLHADLQVQSSNSEEKGIGTLILTNRSGESCFIPAGWVPIGTGGRYDYTPIPATRTNYPGRGMTITLRPGTSAFAGMKWHTGTGCGTTEGLGVAWHSTWIPLTYLGLNGHRPPICDSLVLGTVQPTRNGVNFT